MGSYPLVSRELLKAYNLHKNCLEINFRTAPVKTASCIFLLVGSMVYVFAGPLVILSRSAFYQWAMIGAIILTFSFFLIRATSNLVSDCLRRNQAIEVDSEGNYMEYLNDGVLFEVQEKSNSAYTSTIGLYLSMLALVPIVLMGSFAGKILGTPV